MYECVFECSLVVCICMYVSMQESKCVMKSQEESCKNVRRNVSIYTEIEPENNAEG